MKAPIIKAWRRGEAITAARLDQPRRAIAELIGSVGARGVAGSITGMRVMQMEVTTNASDILTCSMRDGTTALADSVISVAKPYLLRNSIASRGGITYTYSATDTREADDGATTEDQVVVPSYIAGDVIYSLSIVIGSTGVTDAEGVAVSWLDLNVDGRAWAKSS